MLSDVEKIMAAMDIVGTHPEGADPTCVHVTAEQVPALLAILTGDTVSPPDERVESVGEQVAPDVKGK